MALEVYFSNDVQRILLALASAGQLHGPEYHQALRDVALAFGVEPPVEAWRVVEPEPVLEIVRHERREGYVFNR